MAFVREAVKLVPQERVQKRVVEHPPMPQTLEETVEVVLAPHERVQQPGASAPICVRDRRGREIGPAGVQQR